MKKIIRYGNKVEKEARIFRCRFCNTFFWSDEYCIKPDYHNGTYFISECPVCKKEKAYEE